MRERDRGNREIIEMNASEHTRRSTRDLGALCAAFALCALALLAAAAPAVAAVEWRTETFWGPSPLQAGEEGGGRVIVYNAGETESSSATIKIELPPGVTYGGAFGSSSSTGLSDAPVTSCAGTTTLTCTLLPRKAWVMSELIFAIKVAGGKKNLGQQPWTVTVSGGGGATSVESGEATVGNELYGFGFTPGTLVAGTFDEAGADYTQAGGHPYVASGDFDVNLDKRLGSPPGYRLDVAEGFPRNIVTDLPPGFLGNPTALPRCTYEEFHGPGCPPETQIGVAHLRTGTVNVNVMAVYNMVPPGRQPAQFAFQVFRWTIVGDPVVRPESDYAIGLKFTNLPEAIQPVRISLQIWGNPAHPSHDAQRCKNPNESVLKCLSGGAKNGTPIDIPSTAPEKPFLGNPTNCAAEQQTKFHMMMWIDPPPNEDFTDPRWRNVTYDHPKVTDCELLPFEPTIDFEPTTDQADSPTGLDAHLHIPQPGWEDPSQLTTAHLKSTVVRLPAGVAFNASAANGLEACTTDQIGLISKPGEVPYRFNNVEPSCPTASKIANAEVTTPLLHDKLHGEVFLASQDDNPFRSTYAIYIVVREPSILVKLPGRVDLDPATGAITTTFDHNPQLPFSDLELDFFGGPRGALATPQTCGTFTTRTEFGPWSAQDPDNPTPEELVDHPDPFTISQGAGGAPCRSSAAELPFDVGLEAGSATPIAGARSPFSIRITRPDGSQEFDRLEITPPPGFTATLAELPYCAEETIAAIGNKSGRVEQQSPTCPPASEIGSTLVGVGAGSAPFYAPGKLYFAGPYKGHPLSVVAVAPAVAGPYDLGNVVVRSALKIDPVTARITAITDPLPRAIDGVPLRIKDIRIALDKPDWALNPTNCQAMSVDVTAHGGNGASANASDRYQVGSCAKLGFKPRISLRLLGGTKRGAYQGVNAVIRPRPGDANISGAVVRFPTTAFVAQEHLNNICTRVRWAASDCPKGSIYGKAIARSPLLDYQLEGNVHLRSSSNLLPDLVADLRGPAHQPIRIEVAIKNDSFKGALRNTVETAPDAPVSYFQLRTFSGSKGLIVNGGEICSGRNAARVSFSAHNGRRSTQSIPVRNVKCAKQKRKAGKKQAAKKHRTRAGAKR